MSYTTVTLTGAFPKLDADTKVGGVVEIIPNSPVIIDPAGKVVLSGRLKVPLAADGTFTVDVPATDDDRLQPQQGRQYTIVVKLDHTNSVPTLRNVELPGPGPYDYAQLQSGLEAEAVVAGYMTKAEYDAFVSRMDGLDDLEDAVAAEVGVAAGHATAAGVSATTATQKAADAQAALAGMQKGQAGGTAPLDGAARVPYGNLPSPLSPEGLSAAIAGAIDTALTAVRGAANGVASLVDGTVPDVQLPSWIRRPVKRPARVRAFVRLPNPKVYRQRRGRFSWELDLTPLIPTGGPTYYVSRGGSAANQGTFLSPWNLDTALVANNAGGGGALILVIGESDVFYSTTHRDITKACSIVALNPGVTLTNWASPGVTWTLEQGVAGQAGAIYSTPKLSTSRVFDTSNLITWTDDTGRTQKDYTGLRNMNASTSPAASKAAALALIVGPGQTSYDATSTYVQPLTPMDLTNATVRNNLRMRQGTSTGINAVGCAVYTRGIAWEGCTRFGATVGGLLIAEDTSIKYAAGDGTTTNGGDHILVRVVISGSELDNANIHQDAQSRGGEAIELDCAFERAGEFSASNTNNVTTAHEECTVLRVNGWYGTSTGPSIADVNKAHSHNLGLLIGNSTSPAFNQRQNFRVDTEARMYLDECTKQVADYNYAPGFTDKGFTFLASGAASEIFMHGFRGAAPVPIQYALNVGTIGYYTPAA